MKKAYSVVNHNGSFYIVLPWVVSRKFRPKKVSLEILSQNEKRKEIVMKIKVLEEQSFGFGDEEHGENY